MATEESLGLPPGFRFHPTDEEIITYYLSPKVLDHGFISMAMGEVDLNRCEPWDLPSKAKMGEKEWYFFFQRGRKYPTGMRTNRATESGYWKATGKDKEIYRGRGVLVGMKKTLVFYAGRAPKGEKTNWVMHEYRLEGHASSILPPMSSKDEWVVSRIFHKSRIIGSLKKTTVASGNLACSLNTLKEEVLHSSTLPPLLEAPPPAYYSSARPYPSSYFSYMMNLDDDPLPATSTSFQQLEIGEDNECQTYTATARKFHGGWPSMIGGKYFKTEQLSDYSMLSQETGADRNKDISSVVSSAGGDCDGDQMLDLTNIWD
ncbi:hypothetical protein HPP92_020827 [Vanilla planifolia]|uniref:NAC domain-containing protein n=1 Tax=Vanilla planifolia TaxID=51239 RepID=A0A835PXK8_VANPL|nr:hypothetical protein HPP92_020827 [Vanilla planifolia]